MEWLVKVFFVSGPAVTIFVAGNTKMDAEHDALSQINGYPRVKEIFAERVETLRMVV